VSRALAAHLTRPGRIAVALSGGRDSVALAAAVAALPAARARDPLAIHVHHGLSPGADAWQASCAALCETLQLPLAVCRVAIDPGDPAGLEAAARRARYRALAAAAVAGGACAVLLAHHQDDQAETLLLQLARGAGPHGLAGMPASRTDAEGVAWLRPFLGLSRSAIDGWVRARGLPYVDDDSNASPRHRRNALRLAVAPALAGIFPGYPGTLARAAGLQAEAAALLDELAVQDLAPLDDRGRLDLAGLARLPPHRARNVLRHVLRREGLRPPSAARLAALAAQLTCPRPGARILFVHDGVRFGVHRGRLQRRPPDRPPFERSWHGEPELALPHGRLVFVDSLDGGLCAAAAAAAPVVVRARAGGERLALDPARPRRALKAWLRETGLPPWQRAALPLVFCGDALAAVPGLGVDVAFRAAPGARGYRLVWRPDDSPEAGTSARPRPEPDTTLAGPAR
jgi:tRNA(Ile)-lysidine synthase